MTLRRSTTPPRVGFTLIELLVVIAIIAVLISLIAAAVMKIYGKGPEVQCRNDISQLDLAIAAFKTDTGVDYIPSAFVLANWYDLTNPQHKASFTYLQRVFPKIKLATSAGNPLTINVPGYSGPARLLDGNQTLVLFLGGVNGQGFGRGADPFAAAAPGANRYGPYFEFPAKRLRPGSNGLPRFVDPWGTPFIYYSRYNGNDYDRFFNSVPSGFGFPGLNAAEYGGTISSPVRENPTRFARDHQWQIISAGPDKRFGPGGVWAPGGAGYAGNAPGFDDLSNFHNKQLGAP